MIENSVLKHIWQTATDINTVAEIYSSNTAPTADGFDPQDALKCYARVAGITFRGQTYTQIVKRFGNIKRTITPEINSASVDFENLTREISQFEFSTGFEGLIIVIRAISRSMSENLSDTQVLFSGRCDQPTGGNREQLSVTAKFILGALDTPIPRRKFSPDDSEGRTPTDPLFEGFRFMPQYGVTTYSVRERRGGLLGLLGFKKTATKTLQYSSYSDLDANRDVAEGFGRIQLAGLHLGAVDTGAYINMLTAFLEGEIKDFVNVRSSNPAMPVNLSAYSELLGKVGEANGPLDAGWVAPGLYSRTAHIRTQVSNGDVSVIEPAPELIAVILAKLLKLPDASGDWVTTEWSDNPAAVTRFALVSPDYYKLSENWIDDASFTEAFRFNDEIIFDTSNSDFLFVPDTTGFAEIGGAATNFLLPTSSVTPEYFKFLNGEISATEAFAKPARSHSYDNSTDNLIPIEPPEIPEPGPGGGTSLNLLYYLRRRYTCNVAVTEQMKLIDFLHQVVFVSSRMFLTQGANGKIRLHHKKPVDFALGLEEFSGDQIYVDDASSFINNFTGFLLIDPNTNISEVREITGANYATAQNSVSFTASANFTVSGFAGCDGANTPASATITVDDANIGIVSDFTLNGVEISFKAGDEDTEATVAAFIYASINAHPDLQRKFRAVWETGDDFVTVYAKFGTITLNQDLEFTHEEPLANPTAAPEISAYTPSITDPNVLKAGVYRVAYEFKNSHGRTLLSPFESVTLTDNQKITVSAITPPTGASVVWYVVPAENSAKLRYHSTNNGASFVIDSLPLLTAPLPSDINRTGTEVMRVSAVFSDRGETRSNIVRSNVLKASYEWLLGKREKPVNRIDLKFRDAVQDFKLIELRLRDDAHIEKTKKVSNLEINGQAIDNYNQAYRIAAGLLAEFRDADFFYKWSSVREAMLLEEGDVVCITDDGSGVVNLPVRIEEINIDCSLELPKISFTGRKYSTTIYDNSVAEREIPVIVES